jgi:hypothetical protein
MVYVNVQHPLLSTVCDQRNYSYPAFVSLLLFLLLLHAGFLFGLLFSPEDAGGMFL